jgi:putative salt-induced outer membrane protein YdiY
LVRDAFGNVVQRIKGEQSEDLVGNAGIDYEHKLTANTTLTDKLLVEAGSTNTFASNDLAVRVSMTDKLALSVAYTVRHNTKPPAGLEKTDQLTTLNLVYLIK